MQAATIQATPQDKATVRDNFLRPFVAAFPGNVHAIRNLAHAHNLAAVEWNFQATHKGQVGNIAAMAGTFRFPDARSTNTTWRHGRSRPAASTSLSRRCCGNSRT